MEILFVNRFLPHPGVRDSGGQDTYRYIAALSRSHDVCLIAFATADQGPAVEAMRAICKQVVCVPYRQDDLLPRLWRAWWRLWMPRVYGRTFSLHYQARLRAMVKQRSFDVAIVDGMMAPYGRLLGGIRRVLDEVDLYSVVAYHLYQNERRPVFRTLALLDWLRTSAAELHYAASYDGVLVRSSKDRTILQDHLRDKAIAVAPPWFEGLEELQEIPPIRPPGNELLFVGAMNLPANIEATVYFAQRVLPLIRQRVPDARFSIVGAQPAAQVQGLPERNAGVAVVGEVPALKPYYERCAVNVVPLLTGGGVIVKTLNGLAAGRPTVATKVGNSGTGAQPGRDLLVVDGPPDSFAAAVVELLTNPAQWHALAQNGQQFVRRHYDWDQATHALEIFLRSIVQR